MFENEITYCEDKFQFNKILQCVIITASYGCYQTIVRLPDIFCGSLFSVSAVL